MNIVPTRVQEQVNRVDRTYALVIGIMSALTLLWVVYRLFWLTYSAIAFSSYGLTFFSIAFSFVWTLVIGALAGVNAFLFLRRYARQP
jgi:hypothetical protein